MAPTTTDWRSSYRNVERRGERERERERERESEREKKKKERERRDDPLPHYNNVSTSTHTTHRPTQVFDYQTQDYDQKLSSITTSPSLDLRDDRLTVQVEW